MVLTVGLPVSCGSTASEDDQEDVVDAVENAGDQDASPEPDVDNGIVPLESRGSVPADAAEDSQRSSLNPLSISGEIIRDYNLVSGDCFDRIEGLVEDRRVVITSRIACDDPHTYEVFRTFELDVPHPAIYPGDTEMHDYARKLCYEHFHAFVGEAYERSVYEIGVFTPDRTNFEHEVARYRRVHCWLYRDGRAKMASSARGTGI